jgi:hypothetical protein
MNTNFLKSAMYASGLIAATITARSAPLQRSDVAAEPAWVLHVDCDALRPTAIGQFLLTEMEKPDAQAKFAAFQSILGFDPRTQLHGLTLYTTGKAPEDGVLLVYGDFDPERLLTLAKAASDYHSTTYKQQTIHNWIDEKKKDKEGVKPRVYAALQGKHIAVFAQQETRVGQALDVLNRATPNLAGSGVFPQLGASGSTSILQAAARKLDIPDSTPNAALLRLAKAARLDISEAQGQLRGTLRLEAGSEEVATQMALVGQGLVALLKLQNEASGPVKLAEGLSLKQDGAAVVASLTFPTSGALELMKADAAKKAEKKAKAENN